LQGNINVLQGNLNNVHSKIEDQESQAARIERGGREVPETILKNLSDLAKEKKYIKLQIDQREAELQAVSERFDRDIERFAEITRRP
jgi:predicted  nucleic acid-binding Zn-ribbon protein